MGREWLTIPQIEKRLVERGFVVIPGEDVQEIANRILAFSEDIETVHMWESLHRKSTKQIANLVVRLMMRSIA